MFVPCRKGALYPHYSIQAEIRLALLEHWNLMNLAAGRGLRAPRPLMRQPAPQRIPSPIKLLEQLFDRGVIHRAAFAVTLQVLLADIGDIRAFAIFGEQVIIGLLTLGPDFVRDRFEPFLAVGEDRIDIENHPAKVVDAVLDDIADGEARLVAQRCIDQPTGLGREEAGAFHARYIGFVQLRNKRRDRVIPRDRFGRAWQARKLGLTAAPCRPARGSCPA